MTLHAIQVQTELTEINCGECGGTYAINERYRNQRRTNGGGWHCPYCRCSWGYFSDNENSRLKRELEDERKRIQAALARENELRMERNALTRKLKRVGKGICPECKRTFQNLARHMACKHQK